MEINWELIVILVLVVDKAVALSPTKRDDLIWSGIKDILKKLFPGKIG